MSGEVSGKVSGEVSGEVSGKVSGEGVQMSINRLSPTTVAITNHY